MRRTRRATLFRVSQGCFAVSHKDEDGDEMYRTDIL
jgi:hypothetical protein